MNVTVLPGRLAGTCTAPPSKSAAHRAVMGAALAQGESRVGPLELSKDISATLSAMEALGACIHWEGDTARIRGIQKAPAQANLFCCESGSTLRFLIPLAAALGVQAEFTGTGKLPFRPLGEYDRLLPRHGVTLSHPKDAFLPLRLQGQLQPGVYELPGNVSSQYVTGLLLALPLLSSNSTVRLTSPLESKPYVDLTIGMLGQFGVQIQETPQGYEVPGGQRYRPGTLPVEGDYSNAAFFAAAGALSGPIRIQGLLPNSTQGDRAILELLQRFGASVRWEGDTVVVSPAPLSGIEIDASQIPDLVPILAVLGACAQGVTRIYNAGRLRLKESDRLEAVVDCLRAVGGKAQATAEELILEGSPAFTGGTVSSHNDHRMVMCMAVAALHSQNPIVIENAQAVEKSYPSFFAAYQALGGEVHVHLGE